MCTAVPTEHGQVRKEVQKSIKAVIIVIVRICLFVLEERTEHNEHVLTDGYVIFLWFF